MVPEAGVAREPVARGRLTPFEHGQVLAARHQRHRTVGGLQRRAPGRGGFDRVRRGDDKFNAQGSKLEATN